ncbi:hypothetical protein R1sor_012644 [Riccia sorocarpa]|uniref:DUF4218 domain-containing protein n=1 Tax=Riccia sorocarpa TaxID=122646 RepID=A0ABD3I4D5_9MARC
MPLSRVWRDKEFEWDSSDDEWLNRSTRQGQRSTGTEDNTTARGPNPTVEESSAVEEDVNGTACAPDIDTNAEIDVQRMLHDLFDNIDTTRVEVAGNVTADGVMLEEDDDEVLLNGMADLDTTEANEQHLRAACKPLFTGAKLNVLQFVMMFLNICYEHGVPNVAVSELLVLLSQRTLLDDNHLPRNYYHAKRLISRLGLDYVTIHACPKGCVLFRDALTAAEQCPACHADRYQHVGRSRLPVKVLRHFPLIPRIKRMFRVKTIAELMHWSNTHRSMDGYVRHPVDSDAWKHFERLYPDLSQEPRNLHFGLAIDDVSCGGNGYMFTLRAMLLWTVNDYPALGIISGQCTKGRLSCVVCGPRVTSEYSLHLHKHIFYGHRKWLPADSGYRDRRYGLGSRSREQELSPTPVIAEEILEWAELKQQYDESGGRALTADDPYKQYGVKRKSILYELPYWKNSIGQLKSHDFHIFMQQLLPACIRGMLSEPLRNIVYRLSKIFQAICAKIWNLADLPGLKEEVAITLVLMETHLPPAFFDNMTHLLIHLVEELGMCGPVHCRWMYPIEWRWDEAMDNAEYEESQVPAWMKDRVLGSRSSTYSMRALVSLPKTQCRFYRKIQAYGNHYRVQESNRAAFSTFDCGIAATTDEHNSTFMHVGVLKRILQLDYGLGNDNPVLFQGRWVQSGPASLKVDRDGFLLANFHRMIPEILDPFIFPSQVEQVFFMSVNLRDPDGWVIVLHKTPRARRIYFDPRAVPSDVEASEDIPVDNSPLATECYATLADDEEELEEELDHDEEQDNEQDMEEFRNEISDDDEDGQDTCNQ